jgi:hypothetical protein
MRVRDIVSRNERNAELKAARDARKQELRLSRKSFREFTAPEDRILIDEILAENVKDVEAFYKSPEQKADEQDAAFIKRCRQVADEFLKETPEYYKCPENWKVFSAYMIEHNLPADNIDSYRQTFTETRGQLTPVPKPQVKREPAIDKITGQEISPYEVEMMSADTYAERVLGKTTAYARSKMSLVDMFRR